MKPEDKSVTPNPRRALGTVISIGVAIGVFFALPASAFQGQAGGPGSTSSTSTVPGSSTTAPDGSDNSTTVPGSTVPGETTIPESTITTIPFVPTIPPELADDPRLQTNAGRVEHEAEIDEALSSWCATLPSEEILRLLDEAKVPAGPIYSVRDMFADPHFRARNLFETVEINGEPLEIPTILPKLEGTPGQTRWPGPDVGAHNREVLCELLGLSNEDYDALCRDGVIHPTP